MASFLGGKWFHIGVLVQSGRQALLKRDFAQALSHFQDAAKKAPGYVYKAAHFSEGIWTYVGRAHYALGSLQTARQSLERALKESQDDHMARLYLGMTLLREGDRMRGLIETKIAMQGLHDWIERIVTGRPFDAFWDPNNQIRNELKKNIALVGESHIDRDKILASAEWLGREIEEEIERARRDESQQYEND